MTPRDEFAERAVIGTCLAAGRVPDAILELLRPSDVWTPVLQHVAEAAWDLTARGKPCDPAAVRAELLRRGVRSDATNGVWLVEVQSAAVPSAVTHHARTLRDLSVRRDLIAHAERAIQQAEKPTEDPYDVAASLHVHAGVLAERADVQAPERLVDAHEFVAGPLDYDWLVPGLLERGDRLLLTAGEGAGKSVLTRQIAVTVAAGVHPFSLGAGARFDPKPVLLVDLENGTRHLRRALAPLLETAWKQGRPVPTDGLHVESRPSGIDLTRPEDEAWLSRVVEAAQPELLVIGPLYRMHATDMAKEEPARHLTRVLDVLRARHGCALVVETHAPHAGVQATRNLRPVGSSLFMRWPEFGYGLSPAAEDGVFDLKTWRGPRDERQWPTQLRWGSSSEWPWMPFRRTSEWEESA